MLKLENLNCGYGSVEAVHNVSFEVPAASVFALLGPNGAGKTSTIMAIMGHVDIHGGRILLEGEDITRRRAVDRVGLGISAGAGRAAAVLRSHRRREFDGLAVMRARSPGTPPSVTACSAIFRGCLSGGRSSRARCPAASNRCWRSAAR